jgi:hypothetical protein
LRAQIGKGGRRVSMPNFLVIGAQKSGTTALYHYLRQHPQVYMSPVKEPHFFVFENKDVDYRGPRDREILSQMVVTEIEAYSKLFGGVTDETAVGEASAGYLHSPEVPGHIRRHAPGAKLIAVLRDPAERAYSSFLHMTRDGREPLDGFEQALEVEEARIRDNWAPIWHYKRAGFYRPQLERYFEAFGRERIRVYLYEDLREDPLGMLRDVFNFLGVDDDFRPNVSLRHNVSGVPRSEAFLVLARRLRSVAPMVRSCLPSRARRYIKTRVYVAPPPLSPEVRGRLVEDYREDILRLETLIGRDLSGWLA